jgi:RNA polymerase sigma-70 factor (ECF subfamily)
MARPIEKSTVDRLVVEHLPSALRVALRLSRDTHAAEDLVQETLSRVLGQWRSYRGEASFKTWMLGILINAHRDRRRKLRIHEPFEDETAHDGVPTALDHAVAHEMHAQIQVTVDRLPQRQREVAILTWGEQLEPAEVAAALGITEASVYTNLHLARKRVAQALGLDAAGRRLP